MTQLENLPGGEGRGATGLDLGQSSRFMRACRCEPVDCMPVWFMRQAGRYMPEYRVIRARHSLLDICREPELAAEVTLQPVCAFDIDAAILFADILLPLIPMGIDLQFAAGEGPVIRNAISAAEHVKRLLPVDPHESLSFVLEAIRLVREKLGGRIPLIGFAGAPFTLASYAIEGGSSRNFTKTKQFMYSQPEAWRQLMTKLAVLVSDYLVAQVEAGAQAIQLFDSWVGCLSPEDYAAYVQPHSQRVLDTVKNTGVPAIHFGTGTSLLLPMMKAAGGEVIGVDSKTPLAWARQALGPGVALQGNLDPAALLAPPDELRKQVQRVLRQVADRPGHIFNLGHGILPETPVENVRLVVELVHSWKRGSGE